MSNTFSVVEVLDDRADHKTLSQGVSFEEAETQFCKLVSSGRNLSMWSDDGFKLAEANERKVVFTISTIMDYKFPKEEEGENKAEAEIAGSEQ